MNKILSSHAPAATIIIRLMVGLVFLSEGIQKFLFANDLGVGRFIKLGIPSPEVLAPMVGVMEIICGALLLLGFLTRLASIPLFAVMVGAFIFTRLPDFAKSGFWGGLHGGRTDWSMTMGLLFLIIVGAGSWSIDDRLTRKV